MKRRALAILSAVMLLAGCATMPTSGAPHQFAIDVPDREPIGQLGSGPRVGTSEEQLVEDFLRACAAGAFDDYATARLYLLPSVADTWQPTSQVTVFPTDKMPSPMLEDSDSGTTDVLLEVPTMATVDAAGVLNEYSKTQDTPLVFRLALNESGEWRIAALQDGLVLSQSSFKTGFVQNNLYFPSASEETLVADPRWVPRLRVSSHLTQGLLAGPSPNLEGAVAQNVADGLTLPTGGVEVRDRVAYVELEGQLSSDPEVRSLLQWQMAQTLRQSSDVQVVVVSVNGFELDPESVPSAPELVLDRVVAFRDGALVSGSLQSPSSVAGITDVGEDPQLPAVGPYGASPYAWLAGEDRGELHVFASPEAQFVHEGQWVSAPSVDPLGNVWAADADGDIYFFEGGAEDALQVPLTFSDDKVSKVSVAPDGARIALLAGRSVWIGTIVYDSDGKPTIRALAPEERLTGATVDVTWSSQTSLVALVGPEDAREVVGAPVGAFQTTYNAPTNTVRVAGGAAGTGVLVQRADQFLFRRVGAGWREVGDALAYIATAS